MAINSACEARVVTATDNEGLQIGLLEILSFGYFWQTDFRLILAYPCSALIRRVPAMSSVTEIRPSVCPLDCPDTCSLNVTVKDNQIVEVKGSKSNAFTAGVVCNKVARAYTDFVHGPTRLTHPMKRTESGFERISWDDALDLVHRGFQRAIDQHGPESILPLNYANEVM